MGTYRMRFEGIKSFETSGAAPKRAEDGRLAAGRTSESAAPRQFGNASENACLQQTSPAIEQNENRNNADPDLLSQNSDEDEAGHAREPDDRRNHQTPRSSEDKPEQRVKDLSTIEGIDWQDVEN